MKNKFSITSKCTITEANINHYSTPFIHPKRKMADIDFIYMLKGKWKLGQNDEIFDLQEDSLLILMSNNTHYGVSPCLKNTKTMYFHVREEEFDGDCFEIDSLINTSINPNIKKIFFEIVNAKLSLNEQKACVLYKLLLCELKELCINPKAIGIGQKIKELIHKSPEKFLSNEQIANVLNVSIKTAENKFKEIFNTTIHRYILHYKIEQAITYIKSFPEMQIKEIALSLGFYDEYHFSKQFKKIVGVSPKNYRTLHKTI